MRRRSQRSGRSSFFQPNEPGVKALVIGDATSRSASLMRFGGDRRYVRRVAGYWSGVWPARPPS